MRYLSVLASSLLFASQCLSFQVIGRKFATSLKMAAPSSFYDITEKTASGQDFSFSNFKGKVVYGVNVASKCGYTASGYALLSRVAALKDKGIEVAIFPCNQVS